MANTIKNNNQFIDLINSQIKSLTPPAVKPQNTNTDFQTRKPTGPTVKPITSFEPAAQMNRDVPTKQQFVDKVEMYPNVSTYLERFKDLNNLSRNDAINVQKELARLNLYTGRIDAKIGPKTRAAFETYKKTPYNFSEKGSSNTLLIERLSNLDNLSKEETKQVHKELSKLRLYRGPIDDVIKPSTLEAFQMFDARTSNKEKIENAATKGAFEIQNDLQSRNYFKAKIEDFNLNADNVQWVGKKDTKQFFKLNDAKVCGIDGCTKYVRLETKTDRAKIGFWGDAWTVFGSLRRAGGQEIYNVFPEKKEKGIKDPSKYILEKTNSHPKLDISKVKPGDIVNLYYGASTHFKEAYDEGGRVFSTHTGIIKQDDSGKLFVEHNVHGRIHKDPLDKMANNQITTSLKKPIRITAITRPNYPTNRTFNNFFESSVNQANLQNIENTKSPFLSKKAAQFSQVLENNRNVFLKDIPISNNEFSSLSKALKVIAWKETYFKDDSKTKFKKFGSEQREKWGGRESSEGYTMLKDEENLNEILRKNLKVSNEALYDNKKSAIISMYALATKYLKIKNSLNKDVKLSTNDLTQLALISWNEPVDVVIQTANKYKTLENVINRYKEVYGKGKFKYELALEAYNKYIK